MQGLFHRTTVITKSGLKVGSDVTHSLPLKDSWVLSLYAEDQRRRLLVDKAVVKTRMNGTTEKRKRVHWLERGIFPLPRELVITNAAVWTSCYLLCPRKMAPYAMRQRWRATQCYREASLRECVTMKPLHWINNNHWGLQRVNIQWKNTNSLVSDQVAGRLHMGWAILCDSCLNVFSGGNVSWE
jgi:hypothetical protein